MFPRLPVVLAMQAHKQQSLVLGTTSSHAPARPSQPPVSAPSWPCPAADSPVLLQQRAQQHGHPDWWPCTLLRRSSAADPPESWTSGAHAPASPSLGWPHPPETTPSRRAREQPAGVSHPPLSHTCLPAQATWGNGHWLAPSVKLVHLRLHSICSPHRHTSYFPLNLLAINPPRCSRVRSGTRSPNFTA